MSCSAITSATTLSETGKIVTYTVPATGEHDIVAYGAQGGGAGSLVLGPVNTKLVTAGAAGGPVLGSGMLRRAATQEAGLTILIAVRALFLGGRHRHRTSDVRHQRSRAPQARASG